VSPTVAIATLGCKTNQFESAALEEQLHAAGYTTVQFEAGADLMVVNTCTVTAATDAQSRNLIRRARRLNPACRVVVTGCYAQINPQELAALPGVSVVLGNEEKNAFLAHLRADRPHVAVSDMRAVGTAKPLEISTFADRTRAFVQIQNGCDAFCSYCIIPYARGTSRSVPADDVVRQVRTLTAKGYPEIVLTGIHIGGYGLDLTADMTLVELLKRLLDETDARRVRLGSIEPTELSPALIDLVADSAVICPHFHIPLQSGDDNILRRMNRHYDTGSFRTLIASIRQRLPDAAIGLDVISGFPGETAAEHRNTLEFIETLAVSHLHVFPFSRRPGTPAAQLPDQLSGTVKKERAAQLRELGDRSWQQYAARFVGAQLEVVVEGGTLRKGLTRNYLSVSVAGGDASVGRAVMVRIDGVDGELLRGTLVDSPTR